MGITYSFKDVVGAIAGPGGGFALGNGSGASEEGITIEPTEDVNTMTIGADGSGMHSLHADQSGSVTISLLKNSPTNALMQAMYNFQTASSASHGQNTITIQNKESGDAITLTQCAFKKRAPLTYAKEGGNNVWEFHAVKINGLLGG